MGMRVAEGLIATERLKAKFGSGAGWADTAVAEGLIATERLKASNVADGASDVIVAEGLIATERLKDLRISLHSWF